jgi:hypothetical protein
MPFDFAAAKARVRQIVHNTLAVPASYLDDTLDEAVSINVRWHDKINRLGNLENMGWAEQIDGIDRIIFNLPEVTSKGLTLQQKGVVTLTNPLYGSTSFTLEAQEPIIGPIEVIWIVSKQ